MRSSSASCETRAGLEWPTLALLVVCYASFAVATTWLWQLSGIAGFSLATGAIALHSSLTHEMLHGHPFRNRHANAALIFPALSFAIPYMRFRDTHIAHHNDDILTDPYDDPETNYQDPAIWAALPAPLKLVLRFNNTLLGRLIVGPFVGQFAFMRADWALIRGGDRRVLVSWLWHIPAAALPVWWIVSVAAMPLWAYFLCVYAGLSVLKIRTFLEHRAHDLAKGRTVVIEDRGVLAFLFLNNNFHSVHHEHPKVAWYDLPALYAKGKQSYLANNDGYVYRSYGEVFRKYFWRAKDPVPHPLWSRDAS